MAANCEEYVLNKLESIEAELKEYIKLNEEKDRKLDEAAARERDLTELIRGRAEIHCTDTGSNYFYIESIWEKSDPVEYGIIKEIMEEED